MTSPPDETHRQALAVLIGGIGTILVVLLWMRLFPRLLEVDRLGGE